MVVATPSAGPTRGWLAPGQMFRSTDPAWIGHFQVIRIVRSMDGFCHAVLADDTGREISTFVDQIHLSIEAGMLTPIGGPVSQVAIN